MSSKESRRRKSSPSTGDAPGVSARRRDARSSADVTLDENGTSLYVHLPWCTAKCRYCDFNSWAWRGQDLTRTVDALLAEARARATGLRPQTVFIGGGTPSLLPAEELARLLAGLQQHTGFRDSAVEVVMEANPESLDAATARAAREGGVDRLSIGVQSLRPEVLAAYDRVHSPEHALCAFHVAREAGFTRINLDLIYAFPGQSEAEWRADLERVLELRPEHLSCYELAYEPGTALTRLRDAGRWTPAEQEVGLALFRATGELCAAHGYARYEVSAYAQPGEESRHNLAYWRSLQNLGIGAGAVGWQDGERRRNLSEPEDWADAALAGRDCAAERERPDAETRLFDHLMMGLRLPQEGVLLQRATRQSGLDPLDHYAAVLRPHFEADRLELYAAEGSRLRATERGLELLDEMLTELVPTTEV